MNQEPAPLEDIARKLKQSTTSCLLSSMLFSLANQFRDAEPTDAVLKDISDIVNGRKNYRELESEMENVTVEQSDLSDWTDETNIRAYVYGVQLRKKQERLQNYLTSGGYTIEIHRPSQDKLAGIIEGYPLIYLRYPNQEFFMPSKPPFPFCIQHVISAVAIEGSELVFFEPYAGEIRRRSMSLIEKLLAGIGVVKKDNSYQSVR